MVGFGGILGGILGEGRGGRDFGDSFANRAARASGVPSSTSGTSGLLARCDGAFDDCCERTETKSPSLTD